MPIPICCKCNRKMTSLEMIRLWEAKWMCQACINKGYLSEKQIRFEFTKEERECIKKLADSIEAEMRKMSTHYDEPQLDGLLDARLRDLTKKFNICMDFESFYNQISFQINPRGLMLKKGRSEGKHGGDWVLHIEYLSKNNEILEVKLIPLQSKREKDNKFDELKKGEVGAMKKGEKPQSQRMSEELSEDSMFIFYSQTRKFYVIKAKDINEITNDFKGTNIFPENEQELMESCRDRKIRRKTFSRFLWESFESKWGEVKQEKINRINENLRDSNIIKLPVITRIREGESYQIDRGF